MKILNTILLLVLTLSLTHCKTNERKNLDSENFYNNYKDSFLKSDLTKYYYNPRVNFIYNPFDSTNSFRALIMHDSSLRLFGKKAFSELFDFPFDTLDQKEIFISKSYTDNCYILYNSYKKENARKIKIVETSSINVVDYFLNLEKLINKFGILEIAQHPSVNTLEIVFSDHDYLIYKPDSLVFKSTNKEFMKSLFKDGKEIDNNWVRFSDKINTDYN